MRTILAVAVCSLVCGTSASTAEVTGEPVAQLPNAALRLTAYDGYVIFSELDAQSRWRLMAWHDGSISTLDAPERTIPFDADAGPSADGTPAVVFSKCVHEPPAKPSEPGVQAPPVDWAKASGCHVYELALPDGTPRLVRGIYAASASDTTPAIWMGDIAFARTRPGSRVPTLYVWDHARGRLERVGGGPSSCPALNATFGSPYCIHPPPHLSAWVDEMSLDGHSLVYQWILPEDDERPFGEPYAEIRVDPLRGGSQDAPSQVVFESILGGACNGEQGGSPDAIDGSVLYIWHNSVCGEGAEKPVTAIGSYSTASHRHAEARVSSGIAVAVAQDHGTTYWITDAVKKASPGFDYSKSCAPAYSTCTLMRTVNLASKLKPD